MTFSLHGAIGVAEYGLRSEVGIKSGVAKRRSIAVKNSFALYTGFSGGRGLVMTSALSCL